MTRSSGDELPPERLRSLAALLEALADEADPPTTIHAPERAVDAHVADSLVALEVEAVARARRIVDVGAGTGFPGLVLAVALPSARVDLLEASARKCAVIERLIRAGDVSNARAIDTRAEAWAAGEGREAYDVVTVRAVASLAVLVEYAAPLLRADGTLVAWKGRRNADEERAGAEAAAHVGLAQEAVLPVKPFPEARDRHLHVLVKRGPTPAAFPRRAGRAAKRPLA